MFDISVSQPHYITRKKKTINITTILLKIVLSCHIYIFLSILSGTDFYVFI